MVLVGLAACALHRTGLHRDDGGRDASAPDGGSPDAEPSDAGAPVDGSIEAGSEDAGVDACAAIESSTETRLVAVRTTGVVLDGVLDEWLLARFVALGPDDYVGHESPAPVTDESDLSARIALMWAPDALFLAVEVRDDWHVNYQTGATIFQGDGVQIAFDVGGNGGIAYDIVDDWEYGWALTSGGLRSWRWIAPIGAGPPGEGYSVTRDGVSPITTYEVRLGDVDLGLPSFDEGRVIRTSLIVNEADSSGREGYLEWASGVGMAKVPDLFQDLVLVTLPPGCE